MKKCLAAFALAALAVAPSAAPAKRPATFSRTVTDDPVSRMFIWWNTAFKDPEGFTPEAFSRYFTDDAVMRINGTTRAKGLANLAARFRKIQAGVEAVEIKVPFVESFSSPDGSRIFTYHLEEAIEHGKPSRSLVMGYAEIRGGRIALINFLSLEGEPGPMEAAE